MNSERKFKRKFERKILAKKKSSWQNKSTLFFLKKKLSFCLNWFAFALKMFDDIQVELIDLQESKNKRSLHPYLIFLNDLVSWLIFVWFH